MRSSMFFESDLRASADTAAFEMEAFGLTPDEVTDLSERIEDTVRVFFRERDEALAAGKRA